MNQIIHHGDGLRPRTKDDGLAKQPNIDYTRASIRSSDRAMLTFAAKLTHARSKVARADVEMLREVVFGDRAILDIV